MIAQILMAASQAINPLTQQVAHLVPDSVHAPGIVHLCRQSR